MQCFELQSRACSSEAQISRRWESLGDGELIQGCRESHGIDRKANLPAYRSDGCYGIIGHGIGSLVRRPLVVAQASKPVAPPIALC